MDALLSAKWNGMAESLNSGDTVAASEYFSSAIRENYAEKFNLLKDQLPEIVSSFHDLQLESITENKVEYRVMGGLSGDNFSFYLLFAKDWDGIWRIRFF